MCDCLKQKRDGSFCMCKLERVGTYHGRGLIGLHRANLSEKAGELKELN